MTIELSASQTPDPVTWWATVPASATSTPRTAMLSSLATVLTVGSGLRTTYVSSRRRAVAASRTTCRSAFSSDPPSSRIETPRIA